LNSVRRRNDHFVARRKPPFDLVCSSFVMLVPRAHGRNHAAGIRKKGAGMPTWKHPSVLCPAFCRVRSTVSDVRQEVPLVGTATSNRAFRSSLTGKGAGVMVIEPFPQRIASDIPGFIPASRRMSFGITSRPA